MNDKLCVSTLWLDSSVIRPKERLQFVDTPCLIHPEDYSSRESVHIDVIKRNKQTKYVLTLQSLSVIVT